MGFYELQKRFAERCPAIGLIGRTPLVRIDCLKSELPDVEIYAKVETFNPGGSLKDRPVAYVVMAAIERGELDASRTILDSSSGNAGISYAWLGAALGIPVKLVIPDNASVERKKRILAHGAQIHYTRAADGYDETLREVRKLHSAEPGTYFYANQYGNEWNWRAHYETTAEEIWEQTSGRVTHFVAGVGTGGTITGVGRKLKEKNPSVQIECVVPDAFPGVEGLKPLKDPHDLVPEILDKSVIDRMWDLDVDEAFEMNQRLARVGLFGGQSTGGYLVGARQVGREAKKAVIVIMLNDIGERYMSTRLWDM